MFALLSDQSVLRHSVGGDSVEPLNQEAFAEALGDAMAKPEAVAARLFGLRAEGLLHGLHPTIARARLSGFLIGIELAAARPYWLGRRIAVIGEKKLAKAYGIALTTQGISAHYFEGDKMSVQGLTAAYHGRHAPTGCAT
jgi:2-dehydro-3-deoxygalactonokinase